MSLQKIEDGMIAGGQVNFFGMFMQQYPPGLLVLNRLLSGYDFSTIIELGTHDGGLSTLFALYCYLSNNPQTVPAVSEISKGEMEPTLAKNDTWHKNARSFYTFDIFVRDLTTIQLIKNLGGTCIVANCTEDEKAINKIGQLIQNRGRTLIICDAGNKIKEFEIYSARLKPGDIILVHDYFENQEDMKPDSKWHSIESWKAALLPSMEANNIKQIFSQEMSEVFWFCGIKTA